MRYWGSCGSRSHWQGLLQYVSSKWLSRRTKPKNVEMSMSTVSQWIFPIFWSPEANLRTEGYSCSVSVEKKESGTAILLANCPVIPSRLGITAQRIPYCSADVNSTYNYLKRLVIAEPLLWACFVSLTLTLLPNKFSVAFTSRTHWIIYTSSTVSCW